MNSLNRVLLGVMASAMVGFTSLVGCNNDPVNTDPDQFENVIFATPFVGTFAFKAEEHKQAILMALERFEAAGGRPTRPIKLVIVDTSGDAAAAKLAMETAIATLADADGNISLTAIISSSTGAMMATVPFALFYKVPHIEATSGSGFDELSAPLRTLLAEPGAAQQFFAPRPLCMPEPEFSADFLFQRQSTEAGWDKVGIIHTGEPHDLMHEKYFTEGMKKHDSAFAPLVNINTLTTMKTFKQAIGDLMAAGVNTMYYHMTGDAKNITFLQAARDLGFQGNIVTCGMARIPDVLRVGDPDISPYLKDRLYFQMRGLSASPGLTTFNDDLRAYTQKSGENDIFSPSAYDAMMLTALALQHASANEGVTLQQSILAVASGEGTNQMVVAPDGVTSDVINAIKNGEDINYQGASSKLEFTPMHPAAPNGHDHFGYMTPGAYYVEQIKQKDATTYEYVALPAPLVER